MKKRRFIPICTALASVFFLLVALTGCASPELYSDRTDTPSEVSQPSDSAATEPVPTGPVIKIETADMTTAEMKTAGSVLTLDKLSVEGSGWEALNKSLHALNKEMMAEFINSGDRYAWLHTGRTVQYEAQVRRSDEEIVSIYYSVYEGVGGEVSNIYGKSANFDAKSGKRLSSLGDLPGLGVAYEWGTALDGAIYSALSWELGRAADEYQLYSGAFPLQDLNGGRLTETFWYEGEELAWTVEEDGIRFVFQPGDVAPPEAGQLEVTVDYDYATGKLGDKYYPDRDTLLKELAGEWVEVAKEVEGDIFFSAIWLNRNILTIKPDGSAVLSESHCVNGRWETGQTMEMTLELAEGGFWAGFPALNNLEYQLPGFEDGYVGYSFALDGNRLYVWFVNDIDYIAFVSCYYRADDPDRLFPRCLGGSWIIHEIDSVYIHEYPDRDSENYSELYFHAQNWEDAVPAIRYRLGPGEELEATMELHEEPFGDDSAANWFLTFDRYSYGDESYSYNLIMESEDVLRLEEYYRMTPDAMPMVTVYTFWREGTAAETP